MIVANLFIAQVIMRHFPSIKTRNNQNQFLTVALSYRNIDNDVFSHCTAIFVM